MDKRFQFFISSTFTDLRDERQAVLKAILELNHMPSGMELFPAADESAWQLIRDVIDGSDYYMLLIGGRYGSRDEEGLGYTEKEYDYAVRTKKPVMAFLHENPETLSREKTDTDDRAWKSLSAFRAKVEKKHTCRYWKSADDLKAQVLVAVSSAMKRHPAVGWVRADQVPLGSTLADVLALRNRIAELEAEATATSLAPPVGTEDLQQGDDNFSVSCRFDSRSREKYSDVESYTIDVETTWNAIFGAVAPTLINEASDSDLRSALRAHFTSTVNGALAGNRKVRGRKIENHTYAKDEIETCIVQLRALQLITESVKKRGVRDTRTYWQLTPYGDRLMTQLRALRRARIASLDPSTFVLHDGAEIET
jgi:hypothetical protein